MNKVSIIVPVYKVEKYIKQCVESVLYQTYTNLEVILVDDGSPDECPRICDEFAKKDKRVKVIHKENGGLSDARNLGIDAATGDYLFFLDSDDYISPDCISSLLLVASKYNADIVEGNYRLFNDVKIGNIKKKCFQYMTISSGLESFRDLMTGSKFTEVVIWNKLYAAKLFKETGVRFPKGKLHEDNFTSYKLYYYSKKNIFINEIVYYYRQRNDSITGGRFDMRRMDILQVPDEMRRFASNNSLDFDQEIDFYELAISFNVIDALVNVDIKSKSLDLIRQKILLKYSAYYSNRFTTRRQRLGLLVLRLGMRPYKFVKNLFLKFKRRQYE